VAENHTVLLQSCDPEIKISSLEHSSPASNNRLGLLVLRQRSWLEINGYDHKGKLHLRVYVRLMSAVNCEQWYRVLCHCDNDLQTGAKSQIPAQSCM